MSHDSHQSARSAAARHPVSATIVVALLGALLCLFALPVENVFPACGTAASTNAGFESLPSLHGDDGEAPAPPGHADVVAKSRRGNLQPTPMEPPRVGDRAPQDGPSIVVGPRTTSVDRTMTATFFRAAPPPARDPRLSLYPGQAPPPA